MKLELRTLLLGLTGLAVVLVTLGDLAISVKSADGHGAGTG